MKGLVLKTSVDGWVMLSCCILSMIMALVCTAAENLGVSGPESCVNNTEQLILTKIIPELIRSPPPRELLVVYQTYPVRCGKSPNPIQTDVLIQPKFFFPANTKEFFALFMIDLDPPSPKNPYERSILHLAVCNILNNQTDIGIFLAKYLIPTPPSVDPHRYVFLLFKQKARLSTKICSPDKWAADRTKVNISKKIAELKLTFDDLSAINFYLLGNGLSS